MRLEGEEHIHCGYDLKRGVKDTSHNRCTHIANNQTPSLVEHIGANIETMKIQVILNVNIKGLRLHSTVSCGLRLEL